jgi:hypothetical protein
MGLLQIAKIINFVSSFFVSFLQYLFCVKKIRCKIRKMLKLDFAMFLLALTTGLWTANMGAILCFVNNINVSQILLRLNWIGGFVISSFTYLTLIMVKQHKKANIVGVIQFSIAAVFVLLAFTPLGIKILFLYFRYNEKQGQQNWFFVYGFLFQYFIVFI